MTEVPLFLPDSEERKLRRRKWREHKRKRSKKPHKASCFSTVQEFFKKAGDGCNVLCIGGSCR